jgi:hypothetical protein
MAMYTSIKTSMTEKSGRAITRQAMNLDDERIPTVQCVEAQFTVDEEVQ